MRKSFASFLPCADDADREGREELQSGGITFSIRYIGSLPMGISINSIAQKEWKDVGRVCILRVLQAAGIIRHDPEMNSMESLFTDEQPQVQILRVDMNVSVESIMLISATNALRVLAKYSMDHISCVLPGVLIEDSHYFCMFAKTESATNGSTEMKRRCYVFDGGPEVAEVLRMINLAFEVREQLQASRPPARPIPSPRTYSRDKTPTPPSARTPSGSFTPTNDFGAGTSNGTNGRFDFHDDHLPAGRRVRTPSSHSSIVQPLTPTATPPPPPPPPPPRPMALVEPNGHVRHHSDSRSRVRVELTPPDVNRGLQPPPLPPRIRSHSGVRQPELNRRSPRSGCSPHAMTPDEDGMRPIGDELMPHELNQRDRSQSLAVNLDQQQYGNITRNLSTEGWFHGILSRPAAEDRLVRHGDFLVRQSPNVPGQIVLSGMDGGSPRHVCLIDHHGRLITSEGNFETISDLVNHYMQSAHPISSENSFVYLVTPVLRRGTFRTRDGHQYTTIQ